MYSDGWGERKGRAMKGEVCQLHKKISLGLRHGFSELLSFPYSYNDSAAIWPLLRLYQLQFKKKKHHSVANLVERREVNMKIHGSMLNHYGFNL